MGDFIFLGKLFLITLFLLFIVLIWGIYCLTKKNTKLLKKVAIIFSILVLLEGALFKVIFIPDYIATLKANWDLQLPKPKNEIILADSGPSFHGDGDFVKKIIYNVKSMDEVKGCESWEIADNKMLLKAETFYENSSHKKGKETLALSHEKQYLYIYKEKNNKYDWILLLLDEDEKIIYILEHHQ